MSDLLRVLVGSMMRPKPPSPPTTQVIPCPEGYTGSGQVQSRSCSWDIPSQSWVCTGWVTTEFNCTPSITIFVTPDVKMVPPLGGHSTGEDVKQDYGPYSVGPVNGLTMTLEFNGYCITSGVEDENGQLIWDSVCDLKISIPGAGGRTVQVQWNRDYADFPNQTLDASGFTSWLQVPLSEWTENSTDFTVTLLPA